MKDLYTEKRLKRLKEIELDLLLTQVIEKKPVPQKLLRRLTSA